MGTAFVREDRYAVLKLKDVRGALTDSEITELRRMLVRVEMYRRSIGKPPLRCAVIEEDWPEYEAVWSAIERRVAGGEP